MGQYHVIANLDLRECLWSDVGLKACEQLNNRPGPCQAPVSYTHLTLPTSDLV